LDKNYAKAYLRITEAYEMMENLENAIEYLNLYLEKETNMELKMEAQ